MSRRPTRPPDRLDAWLLHLYPRAFRDRFGLVSQSRGLADPGARDDRAGGVFQGQTVNLTGQEQPDRLRGGFVTSGFFDVLGAHAHLGRLFTADDDREGATRVAVLQYTAWQLRFAGRPDVIGQTLILNNVPHTIVGVAAPGFDLPIDDAEIWVQASDYLSTMYAARGSRSFVGFAKLQPGVTLDRARADLGAVAERSSRVYPNDDAGWTLRITPFQQLLVADTRPALLALFAAVGCVLLIACVNLANLVLARGAGRARELSVRAALGAGRGRLIRLLLLESLTLGVLGGIAGFALAYVGVTLVLQFGPGAEILPLIVCDIALSLTLLVGAGLLTRTLVSLIAQSPGFKADHLFSLEYGLPRNKYTDDRGQWEFHRQVIERVRQVPGVSQAALVRGLAFSGNGGQTGFALPGDSLATDASKMRQALFNTISPDYLQTMQIPLFEGRSCGPQDTATAPGAAIVNRLLARQLWPTGSALGKQLMLEDKTLVTIVGVSGSTKQYNLSDAERPQILVCYSQRPSTFATLVARTTVDPMTIANAVKAAIWSVDKDQPVWKLRPVDWLLDRAVSPIRFVMYLMLGAAGRRCCWRSSASTAS